ncbi:MAG TPA: hypothetical protein VFN60_04320 [Acidimicrobiales bacterium]|nr:hypothetical protein [Acidimicrobiales bacterium]
MVGAAVTVGASVAVAFAAGAPTSRRAVSCGSHRSPSALERAVDPALVDSTSTSPAATASLPAPAWC